MLQLSSNSRLHDPAWDNDIGRTNYNLKDGDTVTLMTGARGAFDKGYALVPAGTEGVIVAARTPRTVVPKTAKSSVFANVDVFIDGMKGRVRVPHSALRKARRNAVQ